ncbi:hypothetical protein AO716_09490 [Arthrobacter sp. Edens01]|nr:hypothetical protein AO716_09490 [Arthrobacter sp. Edens01]
MKPVAFLGILLMFAGLIGCGLCFVFWAGTPSLQPPPGVAFLYVALSVLSVACIAASLFIRRRYQSGPR